MSNTFHDTENRRRQSKPIPLTRGTDVEVFISNTATDGGQWFPAKFVSLSLCEISPEPIVQRKGSMPIFATWNSVRLPRGAALKIEDPEELAKDGQRFRDIVANRLQLSVGSIVTTVDALGYRPSVVEFSENNYESRIKAARLATDKGVELYEDSDNIIS